MAHEDERRYGRRTVLVGAGTAAAAGVAGVAATLGAAPAAAQGHVDQECVTITYQNGPDVRFNFDYYVNTQLPLIMRLYGKSISRFELRRGLPSADGAAPPYIATITLWLADGAAFDAAQVEHQAVLRANLPKFTNAVSIVVQRDRIVGTASS